MRGMPCRRHPNFTGQHRPKSDCLKCWEIWGHANPDAPLRGKDLARVLDQVNSWIRIFQFHRKHEHYDVSPLQRVARGGD